MSKRLFGIVAGTRFSRGLADGEVLFGAGMDSGLYAFQQ